MAATEQYLDTNDIHPIDLVEDLADARDWSFDRIADDQIAMAVEGAWRTYSITLAWSGFDETLRMVTTFEMEPPTETEAELFRLLNDANDRCWAGAFSLWQEQGLMVYRYGLVLAGGSAATASQIDHMMGAAVAACERFYPAFQLVCWAGKSAEEAVQIAMTEAYGRA